MAFEIAIESDMIRLTLSGVLTDEDLAGIAEAAAKIELELNPIPHRITVMTGVTELQKVAALEWLRG